jgi:hypothetical protein
MDAAKSKYGKLGLIQTYQLNYNFPRKIKSVLNNAATISADKKSMTISFPLNECIANPEITQLEVVQNKYFCQKSARLNFVPLYLNICVCFFTL